MKYNFLNYKMTLDQIYPSETSIQLPEAVIKVGALCLNYITPMNLDQKQWSSIDEVWERSAKGSPFKNQIDNLKTNMRR